jgi:hypothetical protein
LTLTITPGRAELLQDRSKASAGRSLAIRKLDSARSDAR